MEGDNNPQRQSTLLSGGLAVLTLRSFIDGLRSQASLTTKPRLVEETIGDIVPGHTMPEAYDQIYWLYRLQLKSRGF